MVAPLPPRESLRTVYGPSTHCRHGRRVSGGSAASLWHPNTASTDRYVFTASVEKVGTFYDLKKNKIRWLVGYVLGIIPELVGR